MTLNIGVRMSAVGLSDLDRLYPAPKPRALAKVIDHIDPHAARFISLSPFCVFASADLMAQSMRRRAEASQVSSELTDRRVFGCQTGRVTIAWTASAIFWADREKSG